MDMATKQTESAPSFLQVYTQVRRDRTQHSFLRQINTSIDGCSTNLTVWH